MSWEFRQKSNDHAYDIDKVRQGWTTPKSFTLDVLQLSRLLAHNLAILKHVAKHPQNVVYNDLGGIGMLSDCSKSSTCKDIPIHNIGWGGTCDSQAMALAITLGCIPATMYMRQGRLYMVFEYQNDKVNIDDIVNMMQDDRMRDPLNKNAISILICQLDNRSEILRNMDKFRRKIRLVGEGGESQVLYDPDRLTAKDKEKIYRFFD